MPPYIRGWFYNLLPYAYCAVTLKFLLIPSLATESSISQNRHCFENNKTDENNQSKLTNYAAGPLDIKTSMFTRGRADWSRSECCRGTPRCAACWAPCAKRGIARRRSVAGRWTVRRSGTESRPPAFCGGDSDNSNLKSLNSKAFSNVKLTLSSQMILISIKRTGQTVSKV